MIVTKEIIYQGPGGPFNAVQYYDDAISDYRPGVLVAHTIRGQTEFEREKAKALAQLGYVALAIDMYGQGRSSTNSEEARSWMDALNADRQLLRERILSAVDKLRSLPEVDHDFVGGIGYCFGGKCVLDLARSGINMSGVVSFHGVYDPPDLPARGRIVTPILLCHGWEDPLATPEDTLRLIKELNSRKATWQLKAFSQTGHAFTNEKADNRSGGMFYSKRASEAAWSAMIHFFRQRFGR